MAGGKAGRVAPHAWIVGVSLGVPIIDLDVAPSGPEREPPSLRRRLTPPRWVLVVAVLLLALAALGPAAPPGRQISHLLSAGGQPAAAFVLSNDSLFTASFGNSPNSESAIRRWSLPDGALRWAAAVPQNVQNLEYDGTAHVLMGRSGAAPQVIFLDADTGAVLWHDASPNTTVVTLVDGHALIRTDLGEHEWTVRLVDARTGRQVWSRVIDGTGYFGVDDEYGRTPTRLITVGALGHAVVLRYADGSVLAEGDLQVEIPQQLDGAVGADYAAISTAGDTIYVSRRESGATTLTAWSIASLTRRWQATGGPAGALVSDCGPVLCLGDDGLLSALDPADGRVLWQREQLAFAYAFDEKSLLAYDLSPDQRATLLEPETGAVLLALGSVVDLRGVLLRADVARLGRTWVQVLGGDGALHVVGGLDTAVPFGCESQGPYLACPTTSGPTQVWRLPAHLS